MKKGMLIALAGAPLALVSQAAPSSPPARSGAAMPIALPNAEDMAPLPGGRWVLASSMSSSDVKSGLFAVDTATGRFQQLYPGNGTADGGGARPARQRGAPASCPGELAEGDFSGHGISYRPTSPRGGQLYVVNHGGRESIEIFDVELPRVRGSAPKLRWADCIVAPAGTVGNAVTWTRDGRIYATVTPVVNGMPRLADVRYWTAKGGWVSLPGSAVQVPTGIVAAPDGSKLYVTSFLNRKVIEIGLGKMPSRREAAVTFGPDNLSLARDGALLVGGLDGSPADVMRSCTASQSPACRFPGHVARIDPRPFTVSCSLDLGPTVTTTATQVGNELWFGSSRAPRIWRAPADVLKSCPGQIDVGAGTSRQEYISTRAANMTR